ncbi:MAG: serine hydrolase domain-containing protein [Hyphomicrobiales bacterium]
MNDLLMTGAPPAPENRVTLENWRTAPYNRWSFHNVRNMVPTAPVRRDPGHVWALEPAPQDPGGIAFEGEGGSHWTVARWLDESFTDAMLVLGGDRILFEHYTNGMAPDHQHILMSVSKSVTGVLAGVLVGRGALDPEAPVVTYVPEARGSAYETACVRNLLDMTCGVEFDEDYLAADGAIVRYREASGWKPAADPAAVPDQRSFVVSLQPSGAHGGMFRYISPNTDLLGWVIERASGRAFADLLSETIWRPLGAEHDAYVTVDRLGAPRAAGGICMCLRDLARFGLMMLRGGRAGAEQIVPASWVEDIREGGDPAGWKQGTMAFLFPHGAYRSKWYATGFASGAFTAIGVHGQYLYVVPSADMVIAKFSSAPPPVDDAMEVTTMAAFEAIAAALAT